MFVLNVHHCDKSNLLTKTNQFSRQMHANERMIVNRRRVEWTIKQLIVIDAHDINSISQPNWLHSSRKTTNCTPPNANLMSLFYS